MRNPLFADFDYSKYPKQLVQIPENSRPDWMGEPNIPSTKSYASPKQAVPTMIPKEIPVEENVRYLFRVRK